MRRRRKGRKNRSQSVDAPRGRRYPGPRLWPESLKSERITVPRGWKRIGCDFQRSLHLLHHQLSNHLKPRSFV
jgi:hypothetical protein